MLSHGCLLFFIKLTSTKLVLLFQLIWRNILGLKRSNDKDFSQKSLFFQIFEKTGTFKFQFGIPGKDEGQLWYPRKVAVMRTTGKYVVCDRGNERSRMQIFTKNGHFLKKIAIRYIDIVAGLAVTSHGEIVAVDSVSPTVFIIGESGDLLRWFDCSDYMREPSDIAIHGRIMNPRQDNINLTIALICRQRILRLRLQGT